MNTLPSRRLVPASEIAEILSVSSSTVRRWAAEGEIPSIRLPGKGRALRFDVEAVLAACVDVEPGSVPVHDLPKAPRRRLEDEYDLGPEEW